MFIKIFYLQIHPLEYPKLNICFFNTFNGLGEKMARDLKNIVALDQQDGAVMMSSDFYINMK